MSMKYAGVFIDAWDNVLQSFSSKHIMRADVQAAVEKGNIRDISVMMGFIGDLDGQILMTMSARTGQTLASEMLGGMEITEVDEVVISAVGELCNMIMGNACASICKDNMAVDITPPTIIADQKTAVCDIRPTYHISLRLEDQEIIDFNVAVESA